ncbi:unnamed protein product [Durusdinium trenchii]|uniref:Uncharacterized protein n=2 Tax=Durusdinium trenchii TaxID=1381693 RepID=A0ABP0JT17_9DINO
MSSEPPSEPPAKRARVEPDLKILVDDGEVEVHSLILELASPVFAKMLSSAMKEGTGTSIQLPGKRKSELEKFYKALQLYTMEPLTQESAMFLTQWADEYQIDALKEKCEDFLVAKVPVDGVGLQHAVKYGLQRRTRQCLDIMKEKLEDHVHHLQVLTTRECQEHLTQLWPLILQKAGVKFFPLPPPAHLESMWPFLAQAVVSWPKACRLQTLEADLATWPNKLRNFLPMTNSVHERAKGWVLEKLRTHGING